MKCEKCGREISRIEVNLFNHDGSDNFYPHPIDEIQQTGVVTLETHQNWTGYELTEEERLETIICPQCKQFPFNDKEMQVYEIIRIVCFKESEVQE